MDSPKIVRRSRAASIFSHGFLLTAISLALLSNGAGEEPKEAEKPSPEAEKATPGKLPVNLEFHGRFAQNYNLLFANKLDAERYQLTREQSANYARETFILKLDETSPDGKFRLEKFTEKEGVSALGVRVDTSEITITWLETDQEWVVTRRVPETIPTFYANLRSPAANGNPAWEDYVKLGSEFTLPANPELKLTLAEAEANQVHIEFRDAEGKLRRSTLKLKE